MTQTESTSSILPANGPVAAAILSASVGCFLIALLNVIAAASKPMTKFFSFYVPSGALSGESTLAVVVWLVLWALLAKRWSARQLELGKVLLVSYALLFVGLLLTFPPVARTLASI